MTKTSRLIATAVGTLGLLGVASLALAQTTHPQPVGRIAAVASGAIHGLVRDETGAPIVGATVSALGATTALAVTDRTGRFELKTLSPGPYLIRASIEGFIAPRGRIVQVVPGERVSSDIALRHSSAVLPLLPAGLGSIGSVERGAAAPDDLPSASPADAGTTPSALDDEQREETAWRLRHARRSILKDAMDGAALIAEDQTPKGMDFVAAQNLFGRAVGPARAASGFFSDTPFVGQINLLTTGSFDVPKELFTTRSFERNVAYMSVGAPVGDYADWTVGGSVTQGDISSWTVSGDYLTRAPARHRFDVGMSYSAQRYDGGNQAALRNVTDGSRNAGSVHGFDTFAITSAISLSYGARYARYDYLDGRNLVSPRIALTIVPAEGIRINTLVSQRALAPGAEEFVPPPTGGMWLPPQRTFSSLIDGRPLVAERTTHFEGELEHDIAAGATIAVRAFRQQVDGQLITLFGVDLPGRPPASVGHYFVADAGNVNASGYGAGFRAVIADRVHGSVDYTLVSAQRMATSDFAYLLFLAPTAAYTGSERIHDVSASVRADVPETATRVMALFRVSNGFGRGAIHERSPLDSRFDLQVRQSLPFMDFNNARWEMLVGVRDFFREPAAGESVFDELFVVRPPKRVVGGLTLRF